MRVHLTIVVIAGFVRKRYMNHMPPTGIRLLEDACVAEEQVQTRYKISCVIIGVS